MQHFLVEKVAKIYNKLANDVMQLNGDGLTSIIPHNCVSSSLTEFDVVNKEDILDYIKKAASKSCLPCLLDPIPTWFIKLDPDMFAPITCITRMVNASLSTGVFPESLKHAIIMPIIKKPSLNPEVLKNYRRVSNIITSISKIIENMV